MRFPNTDFRFLKGENRKSKFENRKCLPVLALSLVCTSASAQVDPTAISAIQALREGNVIRQGVPNPLQPTGFPDPPAKRPDENVEQQEFELIHTDEAEYEGAVVHLKGNVEFVARGYRVRCDEAEGNTRQQIFTCRGHVVILGNGANVVGERVTVDFINENYVAERTETQLTPEQARLRAEVERYRALATRTGLG